MSKKTDIMAALTPYVESVTKDLTIGETIIPIKIKPLITPKMRATIVNEVGQHIDDGDGRNFGLVDWAFRSAVVKICTTCISHWMAALKLLCCIRPISML